MIDIVYSIAPEQVVPKDDQFAIIVLASELVYLALTNPGKYRDFAFEFDGQKAIIGLEVFGRPLDAPERTYISLVPPGDKCGCCDGTGVQNRARPAAAL